MSRGFCAWALAAAVCSAKSLVLPLSAGRAGTARDLWHTLRADVLLPAAVWLGVGPRDLNGLLWWLGLPPIVRYEF